jgi:hypothetical protein
MHLLYEVVTVMRRIVTVPYEGKEDLWDRLFSLNCFRTENIINGGDLNFNLSREEIWGPSTHEDRLENYLIDKLELVRWVDVEPIQLFPT